MILLGDRVKSGMINKYDRSLESRYFRFLIEIYELSYFWVRHSTPLHRLSQESSPFLLQMILLGDRVKSGMINKYDRSLESRYFLVLIEIYEQSYFWMRHSIPLHRLSQESSPFLLQMILLGDRVKSGMINKYDRSLESRYFVVLIEIYELSYFWMRHSIPLHRLSQESSPFLLQMILLGDRVKSGMINKYDRSLESH